MIEILQIKIKLLKPQRCTFSDGCWLSRLEVGKRKSRKLSVFVSKIRQLLHDIDQLLSHKPEGLCHEDNICIVPYITGGCSKMDDPLCLRALKSIGINMGHNIMAYQLFSFLRSFKVDLILMGL